MPLTLNSKVVGVSARLVLEILAGFCFFKVGRSRMTESRPARCRQDDTMDATEEWRRVEEGEGTLTAEELEGCQRARRICLHTYTKRRRACVRRSTHQAVGTNERGDEVETGSAWQGVRSTSYKVQCINVSFVAILLLLLLPPLSLQLQVRFRDFDSACSSEHLVRNGSETGFDYPPQIVPQVHSLNRD